MVMPGVNCGNCVFYEPSFNSQNIGQCRHNSPFVTRKQDGTPQTNWPSVSMSMWCGKHSIIDKAED